MCNHLASLNAPGPNASRDDSVLAFDKVKVEQVAESANHLGAVVRSQSASCFAVEVAFACTSASLLDAVVEQPFKDEWRDAALLAPNMGVM
jgi:hypothetical protein